MALSVVAFAASGCRRKPADTSATPVLAQPPATTYPMPPVKSTNSEMGWMIANSQHVKLSDYRQKVVVLDFYATWCKPCRESIPHLVQLQKRYGEMGLQIVGLNVGGAGDYEKVPSFAREFKISYQLGIPDPELESLYMSDNGAIPQTLILDRNGVFLKRFIGYGESAGDEIESAIQAALAAK
jgi:cytochrome c biogenesis protein CcmG/thiol:disulfide interchange protein DsbE